MTAKGNLLDAGIYSSNESGSACLGDFPKFIAKLELAYPGASIDFGM